MLDAPTLQAHINRLRRDQPPLQLVRPCTLGDGIVPAAPVKAPTDVPLRFVPASGAATRLFQAMRAVDQPDLEHLATAVRTHARLAPALRAFGGWPSLALSKALPQVDPQADLPGAVRELEASGWPRRPKGLVPFHVQGDGWTSAIEDHLREAAAGYSPARVHLTAPPDHLQAFREQVQALADHVQRDTGVEVEVQLSTQDPATDTPAIDDDGQLITDSDGQPLLRPGGHGALLANLDALSGLVRIVNVDNIAHIDHRAELRPWMFGLVQAAIDARDTRDRLWHQVRSGRSLHRARAWLVKHGLDGPVDAETILAELDRPIRIGGVVLNDGQPGGGPFWVRDASGRVTPQIVESVEVDVSDPDQKAIWAAGTHFNPVDLACWLDDPEGRPYDLTRFVDDERWIRTRKQHGGTTAHCLERPGLWNGSMSGWLTRFMSMPRETFNPVKTMADLLEERHLPQSGATSSDP